MVAVRLRKNKKRGQTMVEYILLLVVVMALVFAFQDVLVPKLNDIFGTSKQVVENSAMRGGQSAVQNYYADSNKKVVGQ